MIKWFYNLLSNRSQIKRVETSFSNISNFVGPISFVLYINDLPGIFSSKIHIDLFADDTKIYFSYTFSYSISLNIFKEK